MIPTSPRTRFVVVNDNMLGYVHPLQPLTAWILASKPQRGATFFWQDGGYPICGDGRNTRPATRADMVDYRLDANKGYFNTNEYEPLAEIALAN